MGHEHFFNNGKYGVKLPCKFIRIHETVRFVEKLGLLSPATKVR
jgi:hypothetical protein